MFRSQRSGFSFGGHGLQGGRVSDFIVSRHDPVEGEVSSAVAAYKMALVMTHHRNWTHRFACWARDQKALQREAVLKGAKLRAQEVLGKSPAHRAVLEKIVKSQPSDIAEKDNLLSLLSSTLET